MDTGNFAKILNGGLENNAFPCYAAAVGDKDRISTDIQHGFY